MKVNKNDIVVVLNCINFCGGGKLYCNTYSHTIGGHVFDKLTRHIRTKIYSRITKSASGMK